MTFILCFICKEHLIDIKNDGYIWFWLAQGKGLHIGPSTHFNPQRIQYSFCFSTSSTFGECKKKYFPIPASQIAEMQTTFQSYINIVVDILQGNRDEWTIGLFLCTTVLTVVSGLATGCGVRSIHSCYSHTHAHTKKILKWNTMVYRGHYNTTYQYE